jgi:hypothetical protein
MNTSPINSRILATFRKYLNARYPLCDVDMYLAILPVVFPFETHPAPINHLTAMLEASSLVKLGTANFESWPWYEVL